MPASPITTETPESSSDSCKEVTLHRLENQMEWYDRHSRHNRAIYKWLKTMTIASASTIPVLTTSRIPFGAEVAAFLGVTITIIEGFQQFNQFQANWIGYRSTAECLRHEKYLYQARGGAYLHAENPATLLAERVEAIISQENAKWLGSQAQTCSTAASGPR